MTRKHLNAGIRADGEHAFDNALHDLAVDGMCREIFPAGKIVKPCAVEQNARRVHRKIALDCADDFRRASCRNAKPASFADKGFDGDAVLFRDALVVVKQRSVEIRIEIIAFKGAHVASNMCQSCPLEGGTIASILNEPCRKRNRFVHSGDYFTGIGWNSDASKRLMKPRAT